MPRQKTVSNPLERAQIEVSDEIDKAVAVIVADLGAAPGASHVSDKDKVRLWGQTDPKVNFDQIKAALMQGGLPPEMLDEHSDQALAVVKANPEIAQMYGQQLDDRMATIMATIAEYPLRLSILEQYEDDPDAAVAEAERIDGLWQKSAGAMTPPDEPDTGFEAPGIMTREPATAAPAGAPQDVAAGLPGTMPQQPMMPPVMPAMVGG